MEKVKCPHCGNTMNMDSSNYYACESCSTMFHIVEKDGKFIAEVQSY